MQIVIHFYTPLHLPQNGFALSGKTDFCFQIDGKERQNILILIKKQQVVLL